VDHPTDVWRTLLHQDLNADDVMKADPRTFLQALREAPDGHNLSPWFEGAIQ
jgi:hypothetical protein